MNGKTAVRSKIVAFGKIRINRTFIGKDGNIRKRISPIFCVLIVNIKRCIGAVGKFAFNPNSKPVVLRDFHRVSPVGHVGVEQGRIDACRIGFPTVVDLPHRALARTQQIR